MPLLLSDARRVLNVGAGKAPLPTLFEGWEEKRLDLNPLVYPDYNIDAREIPEDLSHSFDAVYLSHVIEHFSRPDALKVLKGSLRTLRDGGFSFVRVPSIEVAVQGMLDRKEGLDDPIKALSEAVGEPITVRMIINGYSDTIYMKHLTHFSIQSLEALLYEAGYSKVYGRYYINEVELLMVAFKGNPDPKWKEFLAIKD